MHGGRSRRIHPIVLVAIVVSVLAVTASPASAADITVRKQPVNTLLTIRDQNCLIKYQFGTIYGVAYAKARVVETFHGRTCTLRSQVVATKHSKVTNGQWSGWSDSSWRQSTLTKATGFGAHFNVIQYYVHQSTTNMINVSAF